MFDWKATLKAIIGVLVPVLYSVIVSKFPDFPLDAEGLLGIVLWVVGLLIGGWQLSNARKLLLLKTLGSTKIGDTTVKKL